MLFTLLNRNKRQKKWVKNSNSESFVSTILTLYVEPNFANGIENLQIPESYIPLILVQTNNPDSDN